MSMKSSQSTGNSFVNHSTKVMSSLNDRLKINDEHTEHMGKSSNPSTEMTFVPWRVFINHVDSYHGKKMLDTLAGREYSRRQGSREVIDSGEDMGYTEDKRKSNVFEYDRDDGLEDDNDLKEEETELTEGKNTRRKLEVVGSVRDDEYKRSGDLIMIIRNTSKNKELLLREIMKCGLIIYDISQDDSQIEEATWVLEGIVEELLRAQRDGLKASERIADTRYFILISTVMTWALTKPLDPENPDLPFTEADYRKRKSHPNFKKHMKCEKDVATIAKRNNIGDKLKTVVIGAGITYGHEEGPLHYLFKMAWKNAESLPIIGSGRNKIPLLHINDLAECVYMLINNWPKKRYIVAVELENISQSTIVKKISHGLTTGKVHYLTNEDAFLLDELSQRDYDMITADINVVPGYIEDNGLPWHWDMPFSDNLNEIIAEYKKSRNLYPLKVVILGPPASGKTRLARKLADHYGFHYICIKDLIADTIDKLNKELESTAGTDGGKKSITKVDFKDLEGNEADEEDEEVGADQDKLREQLNEIRDNAAENNGRLSDDILNKIFSKRLLSKDIENQGYVIDGYPKTLSQAKGLFGGDEDQGNFDEDVSDVGTTISDDKKMMPDLVIVLEASDEFLIERVIRMPENDVKGTHYDEEGMLRRLKEYRDRNVEDETPVEFFDEREIHPLVITVEDDVCPEIFSIFVRCIERLGEPKNYGPSKEELEEIRKRREAEAAVALEMKAALEEQEESERKKERRDKMLEWTDLLEKLKKEEEEQLCMMAQPLRRYLAKYIFPTLTKGLVEVVRLRPDDPIDFLAEYLFRENPEGKMFEPDYTETMSMLLDAIENLQEKILPLDELDIGNEKYRKAKEERMSRVFIGKACRSSSNDETTILTEEEEDQDQDTGNDKRKEMVECYELETSSGMEAIHSNDGMVASSFSYEQIADGSRKSFGNSTDRSLG